MNSIDGYFFSAQKGDELVNKTNNLALVVVVVVVVVVSNTCIYTKQPMGFVCSCSTSDWNTTYCEEACPCADYMLSSVHSLRSRVGTPLSCSSSSLSLLSVWTSVACSTGQTSLASSWASSSLLAPWLALAICSPVGLQLQSPGPVRPFSFLWRCSVASPLGAAVSRWIDRTAMQPKRPPWPGLDHFVPPNHSFVQKTMIDVQAQSLC